MSYPLWTLQTDQCRQPADIGDLLVAVGRVGRRLMASGNKRLVFDFHVMGRHQVITEAGRHMQDVFRAATEVIEHELERCQTRLVGLRLLSGEYLVERRAERDEESERKQ